MRNSGTAMSDINMTPMIDVLLVLIVIFMVLTPLTPKGLDTLLPAPSASEDSVFPAHLPAVITVQRDGSVQINHQKIARRDLPERLREIFRKSARPTVFVRGDRDLEFQQVASVIDVAKGAGISRVALMTLN